MSRWSDRQIAALLFVVSALARIPYRSEHLFHGDSYGLAAGVLYTLTAHPPGFIGYCALVRFAYLFAGDVNLAFVIVNVLATAMATALTWLLGRHLFDRNVGIIAALIYATSLNTSYFAEVALSYAAEGAFATAAGLTAWLAVRRNSFAWLIAHSAVLAIGGSVRQTTLAFLFPLWLWVVWRAVPRWRQRAAAAVVLVVIVALWSIPNAQHLRKYWDQRNIGYPASVYNLQVGMAQFYDSSQFGAVGYERPRPRLHWPLVELGVAAWNRVHPPAADARVEIRNASAGNALRMLRYQVAKLMFYGVLSMGLATLFVLAALSRNVRTTFGRDRWIFLGLWILPPALFFALNHFGAWGYLLIFLAAIAVIAAQSVVTIFRSTAERVLVVVTIALLNVAVFMLMSPRPETNDRNRVINVALLQYSGPSIRMHFARARSAAFSEDPRQLRLGCFRDDCLIASIREDFNLPQDLQPVKPIFGR